jgi:biotin operon repressor
MSCRRRSGRRGGRGAGRKGRKRSRPAWTLAASRPSNRGAELATLSFDLRRKTRRVPRPLFARRLSLIPARGATAGGLSGAQGLQAACLTLSCRDRSLSSKAVRGMVYRRSQQIEQRLQEMLRLIHRGGQSTPSLAQTLHVSEPTVNRCLSALRERGYEIRSVRDANGWSYEVVSEPAVVSKRWDAKR